MHHEGESAAGHVKTVPAGWLKSLSRKMQPNEPQPTPNFKLLNLELMISPKWISQFKERLDLAGIVVWEMLSVVMGVLTSECQLLSLEKRSGFSIMMFNCKNFIGRYGGVIRKGRGILKVKHKITRAQG